MEVEKDLSELWGKIPKWEVPEIDELKKEIERLKGIIRKNINTISNMRNCYNCVKMQCYCELWKKDVNLCSEWEG